MVRRTATIFNYPQKGDKWSQKSWINCWVKKHGGNVWNAIPFLRNATRTESFANARVKDAVKKGWCKNPTGLFINSCKSGEKPKNTLDAGVKDWFESLQRERIVIAMSGGFVYTLDGEAVEIGEMMQRYPVEGG